MNSVTRRCLLVTLGASVPLAGCTGDSDETPTGDTDGPDPDATVQVGHDGDLVFEPERLEIEVGNTVEFLWEHGGHTIRVLEQPDGADWEGVDETQDSGFTHRHTFETAGRYAYECGPHGRQDMEGEIIVGDDTSAGGSGDSEDGESDDGDSDDPTPGGAYDRGLPR